MARFVFQLETVLRYRQRIEKDRQGELARAQAEMVRLERDLRSIEREVQGNIAQVRENHLVGRLDMNYLAAHRRYMLGMQRKAVVLAQKLAMQRGKVDEARRALAEASKQKKILEKLKERRQREWAQFVERRETNELDEISTQLSFSALAAQAEDVI